MSLLTAALDRSVALAMRHLPTPAGQALAGAIGRHVAPRLHPRLHARALAAVPRLRPDLEPGPAVAALWDCVSRTACEVPCFARFWAEGRVALEGVPPTPGRPAIVAGLHLGNWEVFHLALTRLGLPVSLIHDPPPETEFRGRQLVAARRATGIRLLPLGRQATRPALRVLEAGEVLHILVDEVTAGRPMAPRLGRAAPLSGNLVQAVKLARLTGAPIIPGHALRLPGARFAARFLPPVAVPCSADRAADIAAGSAALDAVMAAVVLRHLEQWFPLLYWQDDAAAGDGRPAGIAIG
jgi:KDO2-lipid IV(A) lauroyltransferase